MANRCLLVQNIAGGLSRSNIVKVGLGDSLNMYPETQNPTEHSTALMVRSASGQRLFVERELDGPCRGMYCVPRGIGGKPTLYAVFGSKLYIIGENGSAMAIADIYTSGTEVRMCSTSGYNTAHPHLVLVDGLNCYAVDATLPISSQMTDFRIIELPHKPDDEYTKIKPSYVAYLYGYLVINDQDTDAFYTSYHYPFETLVHDDQTDTDVVDYDIWRLSSTDGVGFVTYSEWSPDNTVALCSNGSKLYTFGQYSYQFFSYNNDYNMPFTCPESCAGNIGIKAERSLAMMGDTMLWLGSNAVGECGVFMMSSGKIERVSTGDLEREIIQMKNPEQAYASIWQEHRHTFYSLTFEDSKMTYVYDLSEQAWHRRSSYDVKNEQTFWRYNHATYAYGKTMVSTDNVLCVMDEDRFEEHDGRPILKMRRGGCLTSNDQPFFIDSAEIIVNNGQQETKFFNLVNNDPTRQPDNDINPRVSMRYSWDGGNFCDYFDAFLGKIGEYQWSTTVWELGRGRYFTLEISTTERIPFCIQNLKIAWSPSVEF